MPMTVRITVDDLNCSRRLARAQIAEWLRGARLLLRHGQDADAASLIRHASEFKA